MNKWVITIGSIVAGLLLFAGGALWGRANAQADFPLGMMNGGNSAFLTANNVADEECLAMGPGMMGYGQMMNDFGMMNNSGMMGMMRSFGSAADVEPLTIAQAEAAVSSYLEELDEAALALGEIMIFDNHAYTQVLDTETGIGAFELLVDPVTLAVFPEPGPNMMWNTEYGMMGGRTGGMMGGTGSMMGGRYGDMMGRSTGGAEATATVDASQAIELAQTYLDEFAPGLVADDHADAFPGYFTLHVEREGEIEGMLSVNAYTGEVFPHHWHGGFVEMADELHE